MGSGSLASKVAVLERPETDVVPSQLAGDGKRKAALKANWEVVTKRVLRKPDFNKER